MKILPILVSLAAANASWAGATVPKTWANLLAPTPSELSVACSEGYRIEAMPHLETAQNETYQAAVTAVRIGRALNIFNPNATTVLERITSPIYFQGSAGVAYNVCGSAATQLQPIPKVNPDTSSSLLRIRGGAPNLASTEQWNAVLTLVDGKGTELVRLQPISAEEGAVKDWSLSCKSTPCIWKGLNTYYFRTSSIKPNIMAAAVTMRILFSRGSGVETRDVKITDFAYGTLPPNPLKP